MNCCFILDNMVIKKVTYLLSSSHCKFSIEGQNNITVAPTFFTNFLPLSDCSLAIDK